jgi:hypothetical protein
MTVSVCIICFNEEHNIRRCFKNAKWADERLAADSVNQDRATKITREHTDKVYQTAWGDGNELQVAQDNET